MGDYADKAGGDIAFMKRCHDVIQQHALENDAKRFCNAVDHWLGGKSDFNKLLDIVPPNGNPHPVKMPCLLKRNNYIFEASVICSKGIIKPNKIVLKLVEEIREFEPIFKDYRLKKPNRFWTDVQQVLFLAFECHFGFKQIPFPSNNRNIAQIIKKCQSAKKLRCKNDYLFKYAHANKLSKKNI